MTRELFIKRLEQLNFDARYDINRFTKIFDENICELVVVFTFVNEEKLLFSGSIRDKKTGISFNHEYYGVPDFSDPNRYINEFYMSVSVILNNMNLSIEKMKDETQCDKPVFYPRPETKISE